MRIRTTLLTLVLFGVVSAPTTDAQYREVEVSSPGSIQGRIRVDAPVPSLPPLLVVKNQDVCGKQVPDDRLLVGKDGQVKNAVVYLAKIAAGKPIPWGEKVVLDNSKCKFVPHVLSATVGQTIEIHNSDPILHDAHARLGPRTLFNVAVPKGRSVHRPLAYPGLVHVNCNVRHTWMHAYVHISEHPYHAVTNEDGRFEITGIPPGTYTVSIWHELLGSHDQDVTVSAGKASEVEARLPGSVEVPAAAAKE